MSDVLPEGWSIKPLGELAQVVSGGTPSRSVPYFWDDGTIPWVTPTDITATQGKYISDSKDKITKLGLMGCSASLLPSGSILMTSRATLGEAKICLMPACTNQGFKSLVAKPGVSNEFLYYQIQRTKQQYALFGSGSTFLEVGKKDTYAFPVMIPDHDRQTKIAELLSLLDAQMEAVEALIAKQERVRAGLMQDLFARGVDKHGRLRPTRVLAPHLYQQTAVGWLPLGWTLSGLKDRAPTGGGHIKTGPFGSALKIEHWVDQGRPVITIGSLGEGVIDTSQLLYVSDETAKRLSGYQLVPGDVVFSRVADVGRSVVIGEQNHGWIMSSNLMRIRLDWRRVRPAYLHLQLSFDAALRGQIRRSINSGGRDVANAAVLNALNFVWPTADEQDRICEIARAHEIEAESHKAGLAKLRLQKAGLMQDLLTGKVSVAPLLESAAA